MENDGDGGDAPRDNTAPDSAEGGAAVAELLKTGPTAGNRSGALTFLAFAVVLAGALHFYLKSSGPESFPARLSADLLTHAELTLASYNDGGRMEVVPTWPLRLYAVLRRDIAFYTLFLAAAVFLWGLSARARARRDAFLVHEKLHAEIMELRHRLDGRPDAAPSPADDSHVETKG